MGRLQESVGLAVAIESVDETLTSVEAARQIRFEGGSQEDEHMEAARLMLESYLRHQD
jgi:RNase H-fold protein (predicted Holliday junction resolvase)